MAELHRLRKLNVRFGSLVGLPACPGAEVKLFKFDQATATPAAQVTDKGVGMADKGRGAGDGDAAPQVEELTKQLAAAQAEIVALKEQVAKTSAAAPADEEINKDDLPEAVRKRLDAVEKRLADEEKRREAAEQIAKAERDQRIEKEWVEKAAALPGVEAATFGPILKRVAENCTTDADVTEILRVIGALGTQADSGELFKQMGKADKATGASAWDKLVGLAKGLRDKAPEISEAQAISKVLDTAEGKDLYSRYLAECQ